MILGSSSSCSLDQENTKSFILGKSSKVIKKDIYKGDSKLEKINKFKNKISDTRKEVVE